MTRNQPSLKHTQLRRNPRRKRIGGVCAGLSDYLGIDVILVRLIFMLSLLFGGLGMALYLVLWIVIPAASPTLMPKVSPRLEKTLRRVDKQVQCLNRRHQPEVADRAQEMLDTITLLAPHLERTDIDIDINTLRREVMEGIPRLLDTLLALPPARTDRMDNRDDLQKELLNQLDDARVNFQNIVTTIIDRDTGLWIHDQTPETHELKVWKQSLRPIMNRIRERADAPSIALLEGIEEKLGFLLGRLENGDTALDIRPFEVRKIAFEYLPDALDQYLHLPISLSRTEPLHHGRTADESLHEQLELLDNTLNKLAKSLFEQDARGLLVHGRFLKEKFADQAHGQIHTYGDEPL